MTAEPRLPLTPLMEAALSELTELIAGRFPRATFAVEEGVDPEGIYLVATVDVEDTDEVVDAYGDRLVEIQVEAGLPVYVAPLRPIGRVAAELRGREPSRPRAPLPV